MTQLPESDAPAVEFGSNYHTAQIYSRGFEFAFMSNIDGVFKQACTFVYCKDFLHDAIWAMVNQKPWQIYSFKYDPAKDPPLDLDHCVFAFRNTLYRDKPKGFHQQLEACQEFLRGFEEQLGFEPSQLYAVEHQESPCWLIIGDKGWQHAPPMVGLYTLLIRLGFMHTPGESFQTTLEKAREGKIKIGDSTNYAGNRDCSYISKAWPGIQIILKHGLGVFHERMADNYPEDVRSRGKSLHDHYGPVSFAEKIPASAMPHWYREEIWSE